MSKQQFPEVPHGQQSWDAELEDWRQIFINKPYPLFRPTSGLFANLPNANQNDDGLCVVLDPTAGVLPVLSDGAAYRKIGVQSAAQVNSVAVTLAALVSDFNLLLTNRRTSGQQAP